MRIKVTFEMEMPEELKGATVSWSHIEEWLCFCLGAHRQMGCDNDLLDFDIEAVWDSVVWRECK